MDNTSKIIGVDKETSMDNTSKIIGVDLAKTVFQLALADQNYHVQRTSRFTRT